MASPADFKDVDRDDWKSQAECDLCAVASSLSSKQAKHQSTSGLLTHLCSKHPVEFAEAEKKRNQCVLVQSDKPSSKKQASLSDPSV
jgi:hypothetical protein